MKRLLLVAALVGIAMAAAGGDALAYYVSWQATVKGDTNIGVSLNGHQYGTQAGAYRLRIDNDKYHNTYLTYEDCFCLDLEHVATTAWWEASLRILPPDYEVQNPPPFNLWEAGWLLQNRDWRSSSRHAAAMQLALWELSHEVDFWSLTGNWWENGSFKLSVGTDNLNARAIAATYLADVRNNGQNPRLENYVQYYEPNNNNYPGTTGQGMMRRDELEVVPEPTTLLLLGAATLAGAGASMRRRIARRR